MYAHRCSDGKSLCARVCLCVCEREIKSREIKRKRKEASKPVGTSRKRPRPLSAHPYYCNTLKGDTGRKKGNNGENKGFCRNHIHIYVCLYGGSHRRRRQLKGHTMHVHPPNLPVECPSSTHPSIAHETVSRALYISAFCYAHTKNLTPPTEIILLSDVKAVSEREITK